MGGGDGPGSEAADPGDGAAPEAQGAFQSTLGYAGMFYHARSGLYLTHYRAYDPRLGRWLSRDPIWENGGVNLYGYVGGDPVGWTDIFGLKEYPNSFIGPLPPNGYYTSQMTETPCGRIPPSPPNANINDNISDALWHNLILGWIVAGIFGDACDLAWFYSQVQNKGPWDYKQIGPVFEDFGNFNYGATGTAMSIPLNILERAAGAANQMADRNRGYLGEPWSGPPYGDDPQDQTEIQRGSQYCKCKISW